MEGLVPLNLNYFNELVTDIPEGMNVCPFDEFVSGNWLSDEQRDKFRDNYAKNSYLVTPCKKTLEATNKPVILIGASPGLKKNVDILKGAGDNVIKVTTPTSLKFLLEEGIKPDYVFALDGRDHWVDDFDCDTSQLTLVATPFVSHEALKNWNGKIQWYMLPGSPDYNEKFVSDWANKVDYEISGGNAISTAMCWAMKYLNARVIVFVGVGLSFGDDYYFDGRTKSDEDPKDYPVQYRAMDIYGQIVNSTPALTMYKVWIEAFAQVQTKFNPKTMFVNCTEEGILGVMPQPKVINGQTTFEPKYIPWMSIVPLKTFLEAWKETQNDNGI